MGFFGRYMYDGSRWMSWSGDSLPGLPEPWLWIDIHDSDITTVCYRPSGHATGTAYLGCTPRTYFENEGASAPTDVTREAAGLAEWWACRQNGAGEDEDV